MTYGGHGGSKCAEQLKRIAEAVKLKLVLTTPALVLLAKVRRYSPIKISISTLSRSRALSELRAAMG